MAQPMFTGGARGDGIERLPGIAVDSLPELLRKPSFGTPGINPGARKPTLAKPADPTGEGFSLQPRGGMDKAEARSANVTPISRFAIVLLLFALAILFLPKGTRPWFVGIILLGAFAANPGAIQEFQGWLGI